MKESEMTNPAVVDKVLVDIADYVCDKKTSGEEAYNTAYLCLLDSIACALQALQFPACTKLLGPIVDGAEMENGCPIPGTSYRLDPVQAAFNIGSLIRWLDYNDTWLAAEWGHPSDNIAGILAIADYISRQRQLKDQSPLRVQDILHAMIKAYEIQGVLALENSFNQIGLDHVILVRIATTATVADLLGASKQQIINAVSNAWLDGGSLRTYRHTPNTGSRKSWAAGDASSRGVWHALNALKGEMGYPTALSAKQWGFYDVMFNGKALTLAQPLASYVMENILFKVSFPAEFHAQTAVEAALKLHPFIKERILSISRVVIETQQAACRIIDKSGPLHNPADRDHCIQYMVAVALLFGRLTAKDYEDDIARNPAIDKLRDKMQVVEVGQYSQDYLDPNKRSITNAVQIFFNDNSATERFEIEYPIGHRRRRKEALPLLQKKYLASIELCYQHDRHDKRRQQLYSIFSRQKQVAKMSVPEFLDMFPCC